MESLVFGDSFPEIFGSGSTTSYVDRAPADPFLCCPLSPGSSLGPGLATLPFSERLSLYQCPGPLLSGGTPVCAVSRKTPTAVLREPLEVPLWHFYHSLPLPGPAGALAMTRDCLSEGGRNNYSTLFLKQLLLLTPDVTA